MVAGVVLGFIWLSVKTPDFLLKVAIRRAHLCLDSSQSLVRGETQTCVAVARQYTALARFLPWSKDEAQRVLSMVERDALANALNAATLVHPDAAMRDRVARAHLKRIQSYPADNNELHQAWWALTQVKSPVAFRLPLNALRANQLSELLRVAVAHADLAQIKRIASVQPTDADHVSDKIAFDLESGAWLCLLGDKGQAKSKLIALARGNDYRSEHARLALVACGVPITVRKISLSYQPIFDSLRLQSLPQALESLRNVGIQGAPRWSFLAYAITQQTLDWAQALRLMTQYTYDNTSPIPSVVFDELKAPHARRTESSNTSSSDPARLQQAAQVLIELGKQAPVRSPSSLSGLNFEHELYQTHQNPRLWLNRGAWSQLTLAALEWFSRGQLKEALIAAKKAEALQVSAKMSSRAVLPIYLSTGEFTRALAILDKAELEQDEALKTSETKVFSLVQRALAIRGQKRMSEAYHTAALASASLPRDSALSEQLRDSVGWLHCALALQVGSPDPIEGKAQHFCALARKHDGKQNLKLLTSPRQPLIDYFLPEAQMYVISRTVPRGDAEVTLDRALIARTDRSWMRARLTAAQWRKDDIATKRWQERLSRLQALIHDESSAVLAGIAGF